MNDLTQEARALLARTRHAHEPTDAERADVRGALSRRLAAGAAAAGALSATKVATGASSASATVSETARLLLGLKWLVGGVVVGTLGSFAVSVGFSHGAQSVAASAPVRVAMHAPAAVTSAAGETIVATPSPAVAEVAEPLVAVHPVAGSATPTRDTAPTPSGAAVATSPVVVQNHDAPVANFPALPSAVSPAPAPVASLTREDLAVEARGLADAQRALGAGNAPLALQLLSQQNQRFAAGGLLSVERAAARVFALCAAGQKERARAEAARFLTSSSSSPLAARVRTACAEP